MIRMKVIRYLLRVGKFVRGFVESHGKRVDFRYSQFMHLLHDSGRIQPSRKIYSHGDVTHQLAFHGLFDQRVHPLLCFVFRDGAIDIDRQLPVTFYREQPFLEHGIMCRRDTFDSLEQGFVALRVPQVQVNV